MASTISSTFPAAVQEYWGWSGFLTLTSGTAQAMFIYSCPRQGYMTTLRLPSITGRDDGDKCTLTVVVHGWVFVVMANGTLDNVHGEDEAVDAESTGDRCWV